MAIPYRKILFATDLSELSLEAWPHATALAEKLGAELSLAYVIEEPFAMSGYENYSVLVEAVRGARPEIERKLGELAKKAPASVRTRTAVLEGSSTTRALLEHAKAEKCDLLVVATHGRGGIGHLLLGSITEKLLRLSPIPVLVVRPLKPA